MQSTRLNLEFAQTILPNVAENRYTALNNAQHSRPRLGKAKAASSTAILETVKLSAKVCTTSPVTVFGNICALFKPKVIFLLLQLVSLIAMELVPPVMIQDLLEEMESCFTSMARQTSISA